MNSRRVDLMEHLTFRCMAGRVSTRGAALGNQEPTGPHDAAGVHNVGVGGAGERELTLGQGLKPSNDLATEACRLPPGVTSTDSAT
jgi:hypothetical protein